MCRLRTLHSNPTQEFSHSLTVLLTENEFSFFFFQCIWSPLVHMQTETKLDFTPKLSLYIAFIGTQYQKVHTCVLYVHAEKTSKYCNKIYCKHFYIVSYRYFSASQCLKGTVSRGGLIFVNKWTDIYTAGKNFSDRERKKSILLQ